MTMLILQTAALLLVAYFLGAWVACIVRRTFAADRDELAPVEAATTAAVPVAATVAPPARRPDPRPIAIETIERAAPHAADDAASRFEKALTSVPASKPEPAAAVPPAAVVSPPAVTTPAPVAAAPRPTPAPPPPAAPRVSPLPNSPASINPGALAAAAAAATAAAARPVAAPPRAAPPAPMPQQPVAVPPSAPAAVILPAASSGSGPATVAAPVAAAEDLTRIRGIDAELQRQLLRLGVSRYRDIAGWRPQDVERISGGLGFSGRIEQENWIEQAQILARGGDTAYSRRKDQGLVVTAPPAADEIAAKPPSPVAPPTPVSRGPEVETRAAFAPAPATSAPVAPVARPAPAGSGPGLGAGGGFSAATAGLAGAAAAAAAAGAARVVGSGRDDLQRISGINAEVERLLNVQGISRYSHIAGWASGEAVRIDRLLGQEGRVAREGWVEQASLLARGGDTAFSREYDHRRAARASGRTDQAPRERDSGAERAARIDDATTASPRPPASEATSQRSSPATPQRSTEMAALRSVRSEAYAPAGSKGSYDDLKRIRGVGVLIEKKLNSMGVTSYAQVANWSAADIDRVSQVLDFRGRIERENWVEQARILAAGGQTEFSRRVDRGEVETSRG